MIRRLTALFERRPTTAEGWLARMGRAEVSAQDQAAFLAWLEADDDRLALYEQAKAARASLEPLRAEMAPDMARLRWPRRRSAAPRFIVAGGLAAAAIVAAMLLVPLLNGDIEGRLYRSGPHEILDVTLADGSRVTLDAGSAVRVALADDARRVTLERGSAFFDVAHDAAHPFQVAVADRKVIVTGTRFATALRGGGGEVSLLDGHVAIGRRDVRAPGALAGAVRLKPGQRASFAAGQAVHVRAADVDADTAWRDRRLVFRDAPLAEAVAAIGRYADRPVVLADPALGRLRVTAVLPLDGKGDLVERVDSLFPVAIEQAPDGRRLVKAE